MNYRFLFWIQNFPFWILNFEFCIQKTIGAPTISLWHGIPYTHAHHSTVYYYKDAVRKLVRECAPYTKYPHHEADRFAKLMLEDSVAKFAESWTTSSNPIWIYSVSRGVGCILWSSARIYAEAAGPEETREKTPRSF